MEESFEQNPFAKQEAQKIAPGEPQFDNPENEYLKNLDSPEKQEAAEKILAGFEAFSRLYGKPGVERLTESLNKNGTIKLEDIKKTMETIPTREEFRELLFDKLESLGVLEKQDGQIIIDTQKLKKLGRKKIITGKLHPKSPAFEYFKSGKAYAFHTAFKDVPVISKQDWQNGERESKSLFYSPRNIDEALDIETIKQDDSYVKFWEIGLVGVGSHQELPSYPSEEKDMNAYEVRIAYLVYHPDYGDGYRDENGKLIVKYPKAGEYKPITAIWFLEIGFTPSYYQGNKHIDLWHSPKKYIEAMTPALFEQSVLSPSDFRELSTGENVQSPRRVERYSISSSGQIMINGVLHYLGKDLYKKPIKIHQIDENRGCITEVSENGEEKLVYVFNLYNQEDDLKQIKHNKKSTVLYAGVNKTQRMDLEKTRKKQPQESVEEYKLRLEQLENFEILLHLAKKFEKQAGVNLWQLSMDEQFRLAKIYQKLPMKEKDKLPEFGASIGIKGVRAFLSLEKSGESGSSIFELSDDLGPVLAKELFNKYGEVLDFAKKNEDEIAELFFNNDQKLTKSQKDQISKQLTAKAANILKTMSDELHQSDIAGETIKLETVLRQLENAKADALFFASVFKTVSRNKNIDFEDVRGLELERYYPSEIPQTDKQSMRQISEANWGGNRELAEFVSKGFEQKLNQKDNQTQFHVLKKDNEVLGFIRFDARDDIELNALYAGSFNISPAMRGSAIGESMMRNIVNEQAKEHPIYADFFPEVLAGTAYIEKFGFVITGVQDTIVKDTKGKNVKRQRLLIRRRDDDNEKLISKQSSLTLDVIKQRYEADFSNYQKYNFATKKGVQAYLRDINTKTSAGMLATRYIADPQNPNIRYVVFEEDPASAEKKAA